MRTISHQRSDKPEGGSSTNRVDPAFLKRHSPRSFADHPVDATDLEAVFEAARWAPSSYNEQPWRFVYATDVEDRERFLGAILEGNRDWAKDAPVLAFVLAKTSFERNNRENTHAWFDTGAAWMSLALQATKLGLATHAMGGIDYEKTREILAVPEGFEVVCGLAIGHAPPQEPPADGESEDRTDRLPRSEIAHEATFGGRER